VVEPVRSWWNVGAVKIPHAERDIAHGVFADPQARFYDILGADTPDDHEVFGIGADTAYSVYATREQAEAMMEARNARYVMPDIMVPAVVTPSARTLTYIGVTTFSGWENWSGVDVPVAIVDQGNTQAVRNVQGLTLAGRAYCTTPPPGGAEIWPNQIHGCLTCSEGVPRGGIVLDAQITADSGSASTAAMAAGIRWAADSGAKVINVSFGAPASVGPLIPVGDVFQYIQDQSIDTQYYGAAGNDSINDINWPAAYSRQYDFVNSVIAFDETTDTLASFSAYAADATGCSSGVLVNGLLPDGSERTASGTSMATPHAASLCARLQTGGRYTARQAGAILRGHLRQTGRPAAQQGGGSFNLALAVASLGGTGGGGGTTPAYGHALLATL
jgi:hypothetical protein